MSIITFGEVMIRFNPEGYLRILQTNKFEATLAGSEANVSVSLANFGVDTAFVTKLPKHEIGSFVVNEMRKNGVDMSKTIRGGKRVGAFFLEKGASQRPSTVIYDREYSAISEALPNEFDWDSIFDGATWFHFSGITPALGKNMQIACLDACKAAKEKGLLISCDINYRSKLWSKSDAVEAMTKLMPYVDICINGDIFDKEIEYFKNGKFNVDEITNSAKRIAKLFDFKKVAMTLRKSISADRNILGGILYDTKTDTVCISKEYDIHIVDRVGGGDSFSAGLIYSLASRHSDKCAIEFAVAASTLKHSIEHDFNHITKDDVIALIEGDSTGRIKR